MHQAKARLYAIRRDGTIGKDQGVGKAGDLLMLGDISPYSISTCRAHRL